MKPVLDDNQIICTCVEATRADFVEAVRELDEPDFERLLTRTGLGMKCTACRLDLELLFTQTYQGRSVSGNGDAAKVNFREAERIPLHRRILRAIDRVAPKVNFMTAQLGIVLSSPDVSTRVLVSNDPPLFGAEEKMDPVTVRVVVRDASGKKIADEKKKVGSGELLNFDASAALPPGDGNRPAIGSFELYRSWARPTVRGTTRPQFVLVGSGGTGGVHTQAANGRGTQWYSAFARSGEEHTLIAVRNCERRPIDVAVGRPESCGSDTFIDDAVTIPTHGTHLFEVTPPPGSDADSIFPLRLNASGLNKNFIVISNPGMTSFSVDHISES